MKQELESASFVVNIEKSQWDLAHSIEWLGFIVDLSKGEFSVPSHKLDTLKSKLLLKSAEEAGAR